MAREASSDFCSPAPGFILAYASLSDCGKRKGDNEDAVGAAVCRQFGDACLLVVADGVGGTVAGEVASRLAVDVVTRQLREADAGSPPGELLQGALAVANLIIYRSAMDHPEQSGMATTCTAALIHGRDILVAHVGDCRVYLLSNGHFSQLTTDHTLAAEYERSGIPLPPEPCALANVLTRWLGTDPDIEIDLVTGDRLQAGDLLILCSDGLNKVVTDEEIRSLAADNQPVDACRRLVDLACERGGPDNVTVQIARLDRS
ncbi:MAG: protein phosphatase 2C domain-containing protein [bacterium]